MFRLTLLASALVLALSACSPSPQYQQQPQYVQQQPVVVQEGAGTGTVLAAGAIGAVGGALLANHLNSQTTPAPTTIVKHVQAPTATATTTTTSRITSSSLANAATKPPPHPLPPQLLVRLPPP